MLKRLQERTSFSVPNSREGSRSSSPLQVRHSHSSQGLPKNSPFNSPLPNRKRLHLSKSNSPLSSSFSSSKDIEHISGSGALSCGNSPFLARAARYSDTKPPIVDNLHHSEKIQPSQFTKNSRERSKSWHSDKLRTSRVSFSGSACATENNETEADEFQDNELRTLIYNTLDTHLSRVGYDHNLSSERCKLLTKILESSTRSRLSADRDYKVAALIFMGEVIDDGIKVAAQCSWNPSVDRFAMATYQVGALFVSAMVLATELGNVRSDSESYEGDST